MWDDEKYYLVAYDAKYDRIIHYRVDKMLNIEILDKKREVQEQFKAFDVPRYTNTLFGMYGGEETKVMLEAENHMVGVLIDRFGKDIIIAPSDEDHFRTTVTVAVSNHFLGWIISLGGSVKIVGPESVVEQMRGLISDQAELY
jgi:predicted DNA-binding transcriptional regulator YafY